MRPERSPPSARAAAFEYLSDGEVTLDMPFAGDAPPECGHRYTAEVVHAWATVLQSVKWTAERIDQLEERLSPGAVCPTNDLVTGAATAHRR